MMAPPEAQPANIVEIYIIIIDMPNTNPPLPIVNILNALDMEEEDMASAPVAGQYTRGNSTDHLLAFTPYIYFQDSIKLQANNQLHTYVIFT